MSLARAYCGCSSSSASTRRSGRWLFPLSQRALTMRCFLNRALSMAIIAAIGRRRLQRAEAATATNYT
jgi:hypothetical protein